MSARIPNRVPYFTPEAQRRKKKDKFSARLDEVIVLLRACQLDRAKELATELRDEAALASNSEAAGRAASFLGEVASIRGDLAAAMREYGIAIEVLESTNLAGSISRAYRGLAHCYLTFQMPRLALQPALDASRVAEMIDVTEIRERAIYECALCEGFVSLEMLHIDEAESHLKSVEHLVESLAPVDAWLPGLFHLLGGRIQINRGRLTGDREIFLDGVAALERVASHFCDARLKFWEARALEALGRARVDDDRDAAIRLVREACETYQRVGAARLLEECEQWLATVQPLAHNRYTEPPSNRAAVRLAPDAHVVEGHYIAGPKTRTTVEMAIRYSHSDYPVLITGESGTGKEGIARMIHALGNRAKGPFVPVNCTAMPATLVESMLFGHKRGAFTGAATDSAGIVNKASGGILFLDEIGDLPLEIQPKLLRFLESGKTLTLGESIERPVDVRVIAATNRNLKDAVRDGSFRADLYFRLNVLHLNTLPLRDRTEEVPRLAQYLAKSRRSQITMGGLNALAGYVWPGNVRQLGNVVARAISDAGGSGALVGRQHIVASLLGEPAMEPEIDGAPGVESSVEADAPADFPFMHADGRLHAGLSLHDAEREFQRYHIAKALARHNGNKTRAAEELGMKPQTLHVRAQKLDLV
ncbi:MAG TPA: sigma-54 dependent transcriptional regulator [Blastocatellia bacterium]|nr:sigma-54 dependent transcriptional regulator [Blastocatellia bacterium]